VVGAYQVESGRRQAFRWTPEAGMVRLGVLSGDTNSIAHGVSADGSVVAGSSTSRVFTQAFRWTQETGMVELGTLPGGSCISNASAVSADGSVIVGEAYGEAGLEAFIWEANHGMRSVRQVLVSQFGLGARLRGWKLRSATAVSPDGTVIVGYGLNPSGNREAWIASLGNEHRPVALAAANRTVAVTRSMARGTSP
jgi:probable HAF family extracellular repeat protein